MYTQTTQLGNHSRKRNLFACLSRLSAVGMFYYAPNIALAGSTTSVGVLTKDTYTRFDEYIQAVLKENFKYVLFIAFLMVVYSGVQYMLSGIANAEAQKLAKQRILGILAGLVFYILMQFLINLMVPNIGITTVNEDSTSTTTTQ